MHVTGTSPLLRTNANGDPGCCHLHDLCDWLKQSKRVDTATVATAGCNLVKMMGPAGM